MIVLFNANWSRSGFIFMQADFNDKDTFYIFNHVEITIFYHLVENEAAGARLVAAKLEPKRYFRLF